VELYAFPNLDGNSVVLRLYQGTNTQILSRPFSFSIPVTKKNIDMGKKVTPQRCKLLYSNIGIDKNSINLKFIKWTLLRLPDINKTLD